MLFESGSAGSSLLPVLLRGRGGGVEISCDEDEEAEEERLIVAGEEGGRVRPAKDGMAGEEGRGGTGGAGRCLGEETLRNRRHWEDVSHAGRGEVEVVRLDRSLGERVARSGGDDRKEGMMYGEIDG